VKTAYYFKSKYLIEQTKIRFVKEKLKVEHHTLFLILASRNIFTNNMHMANILPLIVFNDCLIRIMQYITQDISNVGHSKHQFAF